MKKSSSAAGDIPDLADLVSAVVQEDDASGPSLSQSEQALLAVSELDDADGQPSDLEADELDERPTAEVESVAAAAAASDGMEQSGEVLTVNEEAATDYYAAVKPRPKAAPLAEFQKEEEPDPEVVAAERRKRRKTTLLLAGAIATLVLGGASYGSYRLIVEQGDQPSKANKNSGGADDKAHSKVAAIGAIPRVSRGDDPRSATMASKQSGGPAIVEFEKRGSAVIVPVTLTSPNGDLEAKMVFDTGATFSTLNREALIKLGIEMGVATSQTETANGVVKRKIATVDTIAIGPARVSGGLTFGLCEPCAVAGTVGLLGLNFSRHFVVTLDHESGKLSLKPRTLKYAQTFDIRPFVELLSPHSERNGEMITIGFTIKNNSGRELRDVVIGARHGRGLLEATLRSVPALGRAQGQIRGKAPNDAGRTFRLSVLRASW